MKAMVDSFVNGFAVAVENVMNSNQQNDVARISLLFADARQKETALSEKVDLLRSELSSAREYGLVAERDSISIESALREARGKLGIVQSARAVVASARERFEEEVREGIVLVGVLMRGWDSALIPEGALSEDRVLQEKRRRDIERLKIKIEESGIGNGDAIIREFKDTKQRDEFLAKELADLESSASSLRDMITDLEQTIDARFTEGLGRINIALGSFFSKLFAGGEAKLTVENSRRTTNSTKSDLGDYDTEDVVWEEEPLYAGLAISVSLPRKKIRGLDALSGGERALTSIALIFSMSQVNPPPFLILDETDAALDEANSRRYADMIRELGQKSQLIVITHNRATMAAAGELYGVTMDASGVSKLLSVKLEEAARVAK
jgi:chromosome segregation protein